MRKIEDKLFIQIPKDIFVVARRNKLILPLFIEIKSSPNNYETQKLDLNKVVEKIGTPESHLLDELKYIELVNSAIDKMRCYGDIKYAKFKKSGEFSVNSSVSFVPQTSYLKYKERPYVVGYYEDFRAIINYCEANEVPIIGEMCVMYTYIKKAIFNASYSLDFADPSDWSAYVVENPEYRVLSINTIYNGIKPAMDKEQIDTVIKALDDCEALHYRKLEDGRYLFVNDSVYWELEMDSAIKKERELEDSRAKEEERSSS
ncbi:hypothetical protein M2140_000114 [Clostridiales Family XIII bacterium PM5-7]